ncbi:MAG: adenosylcobinamide-phosphate synthase CbiB, partial [Gammaproteobacteria bacterium]
MFLAETVLLALLVDALVGDPVALYRRVPHPVVLIGKLIEMGTTYLNRPQPDAGGGQLERFAAGLALTLATFAVAWTAGWAVRVALVPLAGVELGPLNLAVLAEAVLASALIAYRSLYDHVQAVARGLDRSLDDGRAAVAHLVGRDPQVLDRAGVARAATESAAENLSDAVVAPVLWYLALGLPGLCAYKAANTLDSMIGHPGERFEYFGKFAARLDDVLNFVPARLTALLLVAAAALVPGASARGALRIVWRDAGKHRSINAGWPEAAVCGALNLALAGPRRYASRLADDPWIGDDRCDLGTEDIRGTLKLYVVAVTMLAS